MMKINNDETKTPKWIVKMLGLMACVIDRSIHVDQINRPVDTCIDR